MKENAYHIASYYYFDLSPTIQSTLIRAPLLWLSE